MNELPLIANADNIRPEKHPEMHDELFEGYETGEGSANEQLQQ